MKPNFLSLFYFGIHYVKYRIFTLVWKFCEKAQFPQNFARMVQKACFSTKSPHQ